MADEARFNQTWYEGVPPSWWMKLLAVLFIVVSTVRRAFYRHSLVAAGRPGVPVIVVGNIVAGGAGKTPLTLAIVKGLQARGFRPGIVTRGYGAKAPGNRAVLADGSNVAEAGDEASLLALRSGVPVCVHKRRSIAADVLVNAHGVNVIVCDDGLQHYALARDIEIAVIDGLRGLGNGRRLPAGPLREPPSRLGEVDHVVINGYLDPRAAASLPGGIESRSISMRLQPVALVNLVSGERRSVTDLVDRKVVAVAGIGNPQRFFVTLSELGYSAEYRAFPDHYAFGNDDLDFAAERPVVMTEKDAVKCRGFAQENWWYIEIDAVLDATFMSSLADEVTRANRELENVK